LISDYLTIYGNSPWGEPDSKYYETIHTHFYYLIKKYKIYPRIPFRFYKDILEENELVIVLLEHIDYLLKLKGRTSLFGYAAYSVSKIKSPLSEMKNELKKLKGIGPTTERIILEILNKRSSSYYDTLYCDFD